MGKVEGVAQKRRLKRNIQRAILGAVGVTGILAIAMVTPNIFQVFPRIAGDTYKLGYRAKNATSRLANKGLLRFTTRDGKRCIEITEKGRQTLLLAEAKGMGQSGQRRWDGRFRIVMFDVPEKYRSVRDRLREYVRAYGFLRLQDSVWVYPYDCEDIVVLLKKELRAGRSVLYAVVESIENDGWIKKHFGLRL